MRYQVVDRCTEPGCRCQDSGGVILYDGPQLADAESCLQLARYPDPQIVIVDDGISESPPLSGKLTIL